MPPSHNTPALPPACPPSHNTPALTPALHCQLPPQQGQALPPIRTSKEASNDFSLFQGNGRVVTAVLRVLFSSYFFTRLNYGDFSLLIIIEQPASSLKIDIATLLLTLSGLQSRFGDNWGQITWNLTGLSPKRGWSSMGINTTVLLLLNYHSSSSA